MSALFLDPEILVALVSAIAIIFGARSEFRRDKREVELIGDLRAENAQALARVEVLEARADEQDKRIAALNESVHEARIAVKVLEATIE